MSKNFRCVYCGARHLSHNGTGSDVACCHEVGHVDEVKMCPRCDEEHAPDACRDPECPLESEIVDDELKACAQLCEDIAAEHGAAGQPARDCATMILARMKKT